MDSVLSEHDNINKNNHPVSIFCRTKVIIGQINQLGWNMVLLRGCPYITLSVIMGGGSGKRLYQYNMVGVGVIFCYIS